MGIILLAWPSPQLRGQMSIWRCGCIKIIFGGKGKDRKECDKKKLFPISSKEILHRGSFVLRKVLFLELLKVKKLQLNFSQKENKCNKSKL